jgi:hypothetical protein
MILQHNIFKTDPGFESEKIKIFTVLTFPNVLIFTECYNEMPCLINLIGRLNLL